MAEPVSTSTAAATGLVAGAATIWAVIDPSVTSIALAVVSALGAALGVFIPLWFKFKTDAMNVKMREQDAKIAEVIKKSDGMNTALVKAASDVAEAKGILAGIEKAEGKAGVIALARSEAHKDAQQPATKDQPLLTTQAQPVAVKDVEGVKLTDEQLDKMIAELLKQKTAPTP